MNQTVDDYFPDLEARLRPLAEPLAKSRADDWLACHREKGQTFREYLAANPVRRDAELTTIYLCLLGDFTAPQQQIIDRVGDFLALYFDAPVQVRTRVPVAAVPAWARRKHPQWGDKQLLTGFILQSILEPDRPDDALAYLALTARDLWPGDGWNFVFGEAKLRRRTGVWSIYRNGYPGKSDEAFRLCLRRTLLIAAHELGHILTMQHCTAFRCLMNGCNNQREQDALPMPLCPVCFRKLCWNLQIAPRPYLQRLEHFCRVHDLEDAGWYARAAAALDE